jgi:HlyD family secretion protein
LQKTGLQEVSTSGKVIMKKPDEGIERDITTGEVTNADKATEETTSVDKATDTGIVAGTDIVVEEPDMDTTLLMPVLEPDDDWDSHLPTQSAKDLKKKRHKKIAIAVGAILFLALILGSWVVYDQLFNGTQSDADVTVFEVTKSDFNKTISETGALRPITSTLVAAPLSGTIEDLYVAEGDEVKKGDKLFLIKNPDLDEAIHAAQDARNRAASGVNQAQNNVNTVQARLNTSYNQVSSLREQYDATPDPEQKRTLADQIVVHNASIAELESALTQLRGALSEANGTLNTADRVLNKATEERDNRLVTAPVDGVIVGLNVNRGSVVAAGVTIPVGEGAAEGNEMGAAQSAALEIADLSAMMVRAAIDESDIVSVEEGQKVRITIEALPDLELSGKVTRIAPQSTPLNPMDMYERSASVTYNVDVRIDRLDPRLRIGMTGEVVIEVIAFQDVIVIPIDALIYEGADTYVKLHQDGLASIQRKVRTGESSESQVVILDGLKTGDRIELPFVGGTIFDTGATVVSE